MSIIFVTVFGFAFLIIPYLPHAQIFRQAAVLVNSIACVSPKHIKDRKMGNQYWVWNDVHLCCRAVSN